MASEPLGARLARLLRECSLEAGSSGMVEDARRVAEKVGIEYRNVEATCRRAEEALFGKSSTEDHDLASEESPSTSASRRSPCGDAGSAEDRADSCPPGQSPSTSPAMASAGARSAEPRRSVKFEELLVAEDSAPSPPAAPTPTPSNGTTPSPPAATAATAAAVSQAGQWPALPAAQKACAPEAPGPWPALPGAQKVDPEADEDGIEHKPSIKNTFVHLREDDAKEADAGAQTCPILHGASWGGKRGSRSRAADAEQAARGTRGSASKCPEDSTKILEDLRTPDMFDATPNKFAWPYTHQGGGVFERTLREQAAETASRRSSLASRRSESQRGSLLQVEEGASTEGSSPDWFQPTPTPFVTGAASLGGGVFHQQLAREVSDSPAAAQRHQAAPPLLDASGRQPLPRAPLAPAGPPPPVAAPPLPLVPPGPVSDYMIFPPPGVASPTGLPPMPPPVPYLNPPPLLPPHFGGPSFGWPGFPGTMPSLSLPPFPGTMPFASPHGPPLMPPPTAPPRGLDFAQGWWPPLGVGAAAPVDCGGGGGGETCAPGQSTDAMRNRRRRGCKKARDPDRREEDPLNGLPVWAFVDLGELVKSALVAGGEDGAEADADVRASVDA